MCRIGSWLTTHASFDYKNPVAQRVSADSLTNKVDDFSYKIYKSTGSSGFGTTTGTKNLHSRAWKCAMRTRKRSKVAATIVRSTQPDRFFKFGGYFSAEQINENSRGEQ